MSYDYFKKGISHAQEYLTLEELYWIYTSEPEVIILNWLRARRILDHNTEPVLMGTLCVVQNTQGCFSLYTSAGKQYKRSYTIVKQEE
jgi:hypothetical protein